MQKYVFRQRTLILLEHHVSLHTGFLVSGGTDMFNC